MPIHIFFNILENKLRCNIRCLDWNQQFIFKRFCRYETPSLSWSHLTINTYNLLYFTNHDCNAPVLNGNCNLFLKSFPVYDVTISHLRSNYNFTMILESLFWFIQTFCAHLYNLKLKLSLINLSNEQNKYLTIRNFMYVFHDEENYALYNLQKHGCVCVQSRLMKESVADLSQQFN